MKRVIAIPGTKIEFIVYSLTNVQSRVLQEVSTRPIPDEDIATIAGVLGETLSQGRETAWRWWNLDEVVAPLRFLGLHDLVPDFVTSPDEGTRAILGRLAEISRDPGKIPGTGLDREEPGLLWALQRLTGRRLSLVLGITDPEPPTGKFLWISQGPLRLVPDPDTWSLDLVAPEGPRVRIIEDGKVCRTRVALWSPPGSEDLGIPWMAQVTDQVTIYDLTGVAMVPLRSIPGPDPIGTGGHVLQEYFALRYVSESRTGSVIYRGPAGDLTEAREIHPGTVSINEVNLSEYLADPTTRFLRILEWYYKRLGITGITRRDVKVIDGPSDSIRVVSLRDPKEEGEVHSSSSALRSAFDLSMFKELCRKP